MSIQASCLCGKVTLELKPPFGRISDCHCVMCRKAHGAATGTYMSLEKRNLEVITATAEITRYRSSESVHRSFCKLCGSNLSFESAKSDWVSVPIGILDTDPGLRSIAEIWTASKAPWTNLKDHIPAFEHSPSKAEWQALMDQS